MSRILHSRVVVTSRSVWTRMSSSAQNHHLTFQPTCDLYDAVLDLARVPSAISFNSYGGHESFCGYAVTVKCYEDNSRVKELLAHPPSTAAAAAVLVIDGGGSRRCALLGDQIAQSAVEAGGWAGIVVWGCVRDVKVLQTLPLGIVALGSTPRKSTRRGEGQQGVVVRVGDICVRPGDAVFVDADGLLVLDPGNVP